LTKLNIANLRKIIPNIEKRSTDGFKYRSTRYSGELDKYSIKATVTTYHENRGAPDYVLSIQEKMSFKQNTPEGQSLLIMQGSMTVDYDGTCYKRIIDAQSFPSGESLMEALEKFVEAHKQ